MAFYLSPGVYTRERDISNIIPSISTTTAALVGYSTKGDTINRVLVTTPQQFIQEYGEPVAGQYFHYTALAFLENGNKLYCLRVINGALYGGVSIAKTGGTNYSYTTGVATAAFAEDSDYPNSLIQIYGKDPGVWNNSLGIRITNLDAVNYTFDIEVYDTDDDGTYYQVESWTVSRKTQVDGYGRQQYVETKVNGYSQYIVVYDNTDEADTVMPVAQATTLAVASGTNGSATTATHINTGWDEFANPDDVDIRILLNGGETDTTVQTKLKTIAEARKDCIAILDMPYAQLTSVTSMVTWRTTTQNFNSSYCSLYAPWLKIYDQFNDKIMEVPPSGYVGSMMAYNDYVSEPWYAPAGFNRGMLNVLEVTNIFTQGERDTLYAAQINPLQTFRGEGNVIWGQKTEQTKASATDRINVRRLLITLEKSLAASLRYFAFEPNSENTRFRITAMCEQYLDALSARGAFQTELGDKGYRVLCDSTNNTPAVIDANQLNVDIYIKPTRAAEFIQLQVIITATGMSFEELISRGIQF